MAPIVVNIAFDKPNGEYFAGEFFSGKILARYDRPIPITEVKIKLKGKGEVQWTKTEGSGDNKRTVHYHNHEKYMELEVVLFQSFQAETFSAGEYYYPFSFILPTNLPETFKAHHGEVKYKCKATVKTTETVFFVTASCKESRPLIIHALVPLPSHVFQVRTEHGTKNLPFCSDCCCCFSSGQVTATLTIDKGGYIPGESIQFNAEISNKSSTELASIQLSMIQNIVFISSRGNIRSSRNEIAKVSSTNVIPTGGSHSWPVAMALPLGTPPTNLGMCKIITIEYHLEIDIGENSGCCAPDVHFRLPFMIGSVPQSTMNPLPQTFPPGFSPQANFQSGYPMPQPGYPAPQPGYPVPQPSFQTGYPPSQPYQPGYPPAQPTPGGYSSPQQPAEEFAPSCPPAITEQPTAFKPVFDPAVDAPKI